jgi:hypothetical protein
METNEMLAQIRSTPRDRFLSLYGPGHFLVITAQAAEDDEVGFNTLVEDPRTRKHSAIRTLEILSVKKAEGNPYPDRISIGRARNCDVAIRHPSVSKLHAHFRVRDDGRFELVDLDSQNGTCVNGKPISAHAAEAVSSGDVLLFGAVSCKLMSAGLLYDMFK